RKCVRVPCPVIGVLMKRVIPSTLVAAMIGAGALASGAHRPPFGNGATRSQDAPAALTIESQNDLVKRYCASCHSDTGRSGGLTLASFDAARVDQNAGVAEKMIRKLRAGLMPPPGVRRPDAPAVKAFVEALENKIDTAAAAKANPGWHPFRRLNRFEYAAAIRD